MNYQIHRSCLDSFSFILFCDLELHYTNIRLIFIIVIQIPVASLLFVHHYFLRNFLSLLVFHYCTRSYPNDLMKHLSYQLDYCPQPFDPLAWLHCQRVWHLNLNAIKTYHHLVYQVYFIFCHEHIYLFRNTRCICYPWFNIRHFI